MNITKKPFIAKAFVEMVTILKAVDPKFMECLQTILMHKTMFEYANDYYQILSLTKKFDTKFSSEFFPTIFDKIHQLVLQKESGSTDILEIIKFFDDRPDLLKLLTTEKIKKQIANDVDAISSIPEIIKLIDLFKNDD